jgi:polyisoprenyl-teichoic acid--peptidoglycan teichoic acid transferase
VHRRSRILAIFATFGLVAAACSGSAAETTVQGTATTTLPAATSTSTSSPNTSSTTKPPDEVSVEGDLPADLLSAISDLLSWQNDDRNDPPDVPPGLSRHLDVHPITSPDSVEVTGATADVGDGRVGVAVLDTGDTLIASDDDGTGWQIVGARTADGSAWFGEEPRMVMVIGSDARVGGDQQTHRADSIHLITANPSQGNGTILGFPRDSWMSTAYGSMKFTSLMSGRGPQVMVDHVVETWNLPVEGYVVTGFEGFEDMMGQIGYLPIELPRAIPNQAYWLGWPAGEQTLSPQRTLEYSRTRKGIPGGDLTRSTNQGLVMLAVLRLLQMNDITDTPEILHVLLDHTWTSLTPTDLVQLGATIHTLDPAKIDNVVVPGNLGWAGRASVVRLTPAADEMLEDLGDDGLLEPSE